jgi:hypothetical protein
MKAKSMDTGKTPRERPRAVAMMAAALAAGSLAFAFSSCSRDFSSTGGKARAVAPLAGKDAYGSSNKAESEIADQAGFESGLAFEPGSPTAAKPAPAAEWEKASATRKLIKTGSVNLESHDLKEVESKARAMTLALGGYVASSSDSGSYLTMVLRVPQERFAEAMSGAAALGRTTSKSENVEDVSLQYADLESRIASKKILRERYSSYLKTAQKVEDLLAVERALNDVISELDAMESSFKVLADQVDFSTVSTYASLPPEALPASQRSFLGGLSRIWDAFQGFLFFLGFALVAIALFGIPAILLLGLLWYAGFGKVGLIRKYFSLLSAKRGKAKGA